MEVVLNVETTLKTPIHQPQPNDNVNSSELFCIHPITTRKSGQPGIIQYPIRSTWFDTNARSTGCPVIPGHSSLLVADSLNC
eukprot:TCALIF_06263-PA protein Name:"Protein of unknown function" AED:0.54 eAED:0.77 QI:0/0/0/1/0/0.5/2/0/81